MVKRGPNFYKEQEATGVALRVTERATNNLGLDARLPALMSASGAVNAHFRRSVRRFSASESTRSTVMKEFLPPT